MLSVNYCSSCFVSFSKRQQSTTGQWHWGNPMSCPYLFPWRQTLIVVRQIVLMKIHYTARDKGHILFPQDGIMSFSLFHYYQSFDLYLDACSFRLINSTQVLWIYSSLICACSSLISQFTMDCQVSSRKSVESLRSSI